MLRVGLNNDGRTLKAKGAVFREDRDVNHVGDVRVVEEMCG
jgi:hypothetical protein